MDTLSPTVSFNTLCALSPSILFALSPSILFALVVQFDMDIQQTDVDSAFLYADLQEEIYMEQPRGFRQWSKDSSRLVCKLRKVIYGLKQAPFEW